MGEGRFSYLGGYDVPIDTPPASIREAQQQLPNRGEEGVRKFLEGLNRLHELPSSSTEKFVDIEEAESRAQVGSSRFAPTRTQQEEVDLRGSRELGVRVREFFLKTRQEKKAR